MAAATHRAVRRIARHLAVVGLTVALIGSASACRDDSDGGTPAKRSPSPASGQGLTQQVSIIGAKYTFRVEPMARQDDKVVLTVHARLDATAPGETRHFLGYALADPWMEFLVKLVDVRGRRAYLPARRKDGQGCACTSGTQSWLWIKPGESDAAQAVFTGVPADVTALDVMVQSVGVFADVPVTNAPVPLLTGLGTGGSKSKEPLDLSDVGPSTVGDISSFVTEADGSVSVTTEPRRTEIRLATDVLFATDSAVPSAKATAAIEAAARQVRSSGPGELTITGHTDNRGTSAHNMTLSRQRAAAVARALAQLLPVDQWPQRVSGKGETDPIAPNTSEPGHRANRRVVIEYRTAPGSKPTAAPTGSPAGATSGGPARLPVATGVVGSAPAGVRVELPKNGGSVRVRPHAMIPRDGLLVVQLAIRNEGRSEVTIGDYLSAGVWTGRGEFQPDELFAANGLQLLEPGRAYYPLDYERAERDHFALCDLYLNTGIPPGTEQIITVWFPRPADAGKTLVLDLPGILRITDIPLER